MADLLRADYRLAIDETLYRCLDKVLKHKAALFAHLQQRWTDLFAAEFDVLLLRPDQHVFRERPALSEGR